MYIDLPNWCLTKIPGYGSLNLRRFWGDGKVRFVAYEAESVKVPNTISHSQSTNTYLLRVEFQYLGDQLAREQQERERQKRELKQKQRMLSNDGGDNNHKKKRR